MEGQSLKEWFDKQKTSEKKQKLPQTITAEKVLQSRIFKFDDKGNPTGLAKLITQQNQNIKTPSKSSFKSSCIKNEFMPEFINELSHQIDRCKEPIEADDIEIFYYQLTSIYEIELTQFFKGIGISREELGKPFSDLIKKVKRITMKRIKNGKFQGVTSPKSKAFTNAMWVNVLEGIFRKYFEDLNKSDIRMYLSYLLNDCGIEKNSTPKQIYDKIRKWSSPSRYGIEIEKTNKRMSSISSRIKKTC